MPRGLFGYVWKTSARHQVALAALSVALGAGVLGIAWLELAKLAWRR